MTRPLIQGVLWLAAAAAGLFVVAACLGGSEAEAVRKAALWALGVSLPFLLPAGVLLRHRKPWFEGLYVAGFLVRLVLLGVAMAISKDRDFPAALALSMFALELVGVAWMGARLRVASAC